MNEIPEIDLERLPFEIQRSMVLDHGVFPTDVDPGLSAIPEADHLRIVDGAGTTVAEIPRYRLAPVDLDYLAESIAAEADPTEGAALDQALAAVRAGRAFDRPDRDYLVIPTAEGAEGLAAALIVSRAAAVPSWPASDQCDPDTARAEVNALAQSYPWGYDDGR